MLWSIPLGCLLASSWLLLGPLGTKVRKKRSGNISSFLFSYIPRSEVEGTYLDMSCNLLLLICIAASPTLFHTPINGVSEAIGHFSFPPTCYRRGFRNPTQDREWCILVPSQLRHSNHSRQVHQESCNRTPPKPSSTSTRTSSLKAITCSFHLIPRRPSWYVSFIVVPVV